MPEQTNKHNNQYNVVIVGSGFSGVVAAGMLADKGLSILLVDENIHVGGQLLRKVPEELGEYANYKPDYVKRIGFAFVDNVRKKKITIMNRTCLVGVYPERRLMLERNHNEVISVRYDILLFATGARERYLPFKGWTLPGVYSAGMAQVMMKSNGVMPAKNMMVAGSGLFLFSVAYEFLKNGGKIPAVLEQTGMMDKIKLLPQLFHNPSKMTEGARFLSKIYFSGVPVKYRRRVVEARGNGCVEEVVTARVNRSGRVLEGTEKVYKTDALAVGYGFTPNVEGPQAAGCELEFSQAMGGWTVTVNDRLETSQENVLAAGEITGVGGALKSITEGKIAALTILDKFDKIESDDYDRQMKTLKKERGHHMAFVRLFNGLYGISDAAVESIADDVVVCRCEDITMGAIRDGITCGFSTPRGIKSAVRVSMGNCQGRTCGPIIYDIMDVLGSKDPEEMGPFYTRPPLKPVSISALAKYEEREPTEHTEDTE